MCRLLSIILYIRLFRPGARSSAGLFVYIVKMDSQVRKSSKSNVFCCVDGCNSLARRNPELSFHYFPGPRRITTTIVNRLGDTDKVDCRKAQELRLLIGKPVSEHMRCLLL